MRRLLLTAFAAIAGLGTTAAAPFSALLPLSEKDQMSSKEMGCTASFYQANNTYIQLINRELMIRTSSGLKVCHITAKQDELFSDARGTVSCAGHTLRIQRTGKVIGHEASDSASGPALLTVTVGKKSTPLRGMFGTAC